jgi:hypothetical protein
MGAVMLISPLSQSYFYDKWLLKKRCLPSSFSASIGHIKAPLEYFADDGPKPSNIFFIQLVAGSGAFDNAGDPAGVFEHLKMLRYGSLGNREIFDNITRDASRMSHQKLDDFKPDRISQGFEHTDQLLLLLAGNIQCTACGGYRCFCLWHVIRFHQSYFYDKQYQAEYGIVNPGLNYLIKIFL